MSFAAYSLSAASSQTPAQVTSRIIRTVWFSSISAPSCFAGDQIHRETIPIRSVSYPVLFDRACAETGAPLLAPIASSTPDSMAILIAAGRRGWRKMNQRAVFGQMSHRRRAREGCDSIYTSNRILISDSAGVSAARLSLRIASSKSTCAWPLPLVSARAAFLTLSIALDTSISGNELILEVPMKGRWQRQADTVSNVTSRILLLTTLATRKEPF